MKPSLPNVIKNNIFKGTWSIHYF